MCSDSVSTFGLFDGIKRIRSGGVNLLFERKVSNANLFRPNDNFS